MFPNLETVACYPTSCWPAVSLFVTSARGPFVFAQTRHSETTAGTVTSSENLSAVHIPDTFRATRVWPIAFPSALFLGHGLPLDLLWLPVIATERSSDAKAKRYTQGNTETNAKKLTPDAFLLCLATHLFRHLPPLRLSTPAVVILAEPCKQTHRRRVSAVCCRTRVRRHFYKLACRSDLFVGILSSAICEPAWNGTEHCRWLVILNKCSHAVHRHVLGELPI